MFAALFISPPFLRLGLAARSSRQPHVPLVSGCVIAGSIAFASPRMRNLEQDFVKENT